MAYLAGRATSAPGTSLCIAVIDGRREEPSGLCREVRRIVEWNGTDDIPDLLRDELSFGPSSETQIPVSDQMSKQSPAAALAARVRSPRRQDSARGRSVRSLTYAVAAISAVLILACAL